MKLESLTLVQLATIYNEVSDRPIKKFSDKDAAVRRTRNALITANKTLDPDFRVVDMEEGKVAVVTRKFQDDDLIVLNDEHNPKREGTLAADYYLLYKTCKTVGEFRKAFMLVDPRMTVKRAHRSLCHDSDKGHITVHRSLASSQV